MISSFMVVFAFLLWPVCILVLLLRGLAFAPLRKIIFGCVSTQAMMNELVSRNLSNFAKNQASKKVVAWTDFGQMKGGGYRNGK